MGRDGRVTRVDSLWADPSDPALDRLGCAFQVGQRRQIAGGLLIGNAVDPRMDDPWLHPRAEARVIHAERLVPREQKPADSGGRSRRAASQPRLPAWS